MHDSLSVMATEDIKHRCFPFCLFRNEPLIAQSNGKDWSLSFGNLRLFSVLIHAAGEGQEVSLNIKV